jgi:crotonobetainyl-CoA:carnitine CoA-transferase CaiB-like acyl-CoA transferase
VKVLDLSQGVSGPFCTLMLADLGASIIKVEPPAVGDIARAWGPPFVEQNASAYFYSLNRSKNSVVLNLKAPLGRKAFEELVESADVLVENFKPGVMANLGYDWGSIREKNKRLVYCAISGYGQNGPSSSQPAFDIAIQARSGLLSVNGDAVGSPTKIGIPLVDLGAGMYASFAISSALLERERTGLGTFIDISMLDSAISWLSYWLTGFSVTGKDLPRTGNAHPTIAPYQLFQTQDGEVALAITSDKLWQRFVHSADLEELLDDTRFAHNDNRLTHRNELAEIIKAKLSCFTTNEFVDRMTDAGVPCAPVQSVSEAVKDSQVLFRNMVLRFGDALVPGNPIKMSSLTEATNKPPPKLGEYTYEVLESLGWEKSEIMKLVSET